MERRTEDRYHITSLEYIALASDNGGIVVDISNGGIGVQTVAAPQPSTTIDFSVVVSQFRTPIEGTAQVIWVTASGQAGLRFTHLPENARERIAEWIRTITTTQDNDRETGSAQQTEATPCRSSAPTAIEKTIVTSSTSPAVDLEDTLPLSQRAIETCGRQGGWSIYMVGWFESNHFRVKRVGRSSDLANELYSYIGQYEAFKFSYCASEKHAFQEECKLFHQLRPSDNKSHPRRPANADWDCPVCRGFS